MANSVVLITDKVMMMTRSMVCMAMRYQPFGGGTAADISGYVNRQLPDNNGQLHVGVIERVLQDLRSDGVVGEVSGRWYLAATV